MPRASSWAEPQPLTTFRRLADPAVVGGRHVSVLGNLVGLKPDHAALAPDRDGVAEPLVLERRFAYRAPHRGQNARDVLDPVEGLGSDSGDRFTLAPPEAASTPGRRPRPAVAPRGATSRPVAPGARNRFESAPPSGASR